MKVAFKSIAVAIIAIEMCGCVTQFEGDVVSAKDVNVFYAVDETYLRPTPKIAKQLAKDASFNCYGVYSIYRDCDDRSSAMAQWIRDKYAGSPIGGCQTVAVFKLLIIGHQIIVIETTDGDMFFDNDGSVMSAPDFEIGRFQ